MRQIADIGIGIVLAAIGYMDLRRRYLPVWVLALFNVVSIALCILIRRNGLFSVLGGVCIGAIFFLTSRLTHEAIGYGDSWLILSLGIYLGLRKILGIIFVASLLACAGSLFLCLARDWQKKRGLPFVPFLAAAYGLVVFS